jgi:hypothetical protein
MGFKPRRREDMKVPKGIGISGYQKSRGQEIRNLYSENPETDMSRPSVGTRGRDWEPSTFQDSDFHES